MIAHEGVNDKTWGIIGSEKVKYAKVVQTAVGGVTLSEGSVFLEPCAEFAAQLRQKRLTFGGLKAIVAHQMCGARIYKLAKSVELFRNNNRDLITPSY